MELQAFETQVRRLQTKYGNEIPGFEAPELLEMSPIQFVDLLNSGKGPASSYEERFREHREFHEQEPYFHTGMIYKAPDGTCMLSFHFRDLVTWGRKQAKQDISMAERLEAVKKDRDYWKRQAKEAIPPRPWTGVEQEIKKIHDSFEESLKAPIPRYGVLNQVEKERDRALKRVAELERQLDGKALPQDREALEKTRKELEAEQTAHEKTREELAQLRKGAMELDQELVRTHNENTFLQKERDERDDKIARLEDEIRDLRLHLAEKPEGQGVDTEQAEALRKELEDTKAKLQDALEGHGLCSLVIRWRQEGKTDQEIDSELERLNVKRDIHRATLLYKGSGAAEEAARKKAYERLYEKEPVTTL